MTLEYHIGFTGNQDGMTDEQKKVLRERLSKFFSEDSFTYVGHHGDCIGCDAEFHDIVKELGGLITLHPPDVDEKRAFKEPDRQFLPAPYMERNQDIVDQSRFMFATPGQKFEVTRSGTWSTIRKARMKEIPIVIVYPDGSLEVE